MPTIEEVLRYGLAAHRTGKLDIAENVYRQVLEFDPRQPDALHFMAVLDNQRGRYDQAIERISRAIEVDSGNAAYRLTLADALSAVGRMEDAITAYRGALELRSELGEAYVGLGTALHRLRRFSDAIPHYQRARALGIVDYEGLENLGTAAFSLGDFTVAAAAFFQALALRPDQPAMQHQVGMAVERLGRRAEAMQRYRMALALDADFGDARQRVGLLLFGEGDVAAAVEEYREVLRRTPDHAEAHRAYLQCMLLLQPDLGASTILAERRQWSDRHARPIEARAIAAGALVFNNNRDPDRRLRLGYIGGSTLCGTTHVHSVLPMIEAHDRAQFEIFCYADMASARSDQFTARYVAASDQWRDVYGLGDGAVADMMRADGIDVAVDIVGHLGGPRALVFPHHPAPVQIALFPTGTTGQVGYNFLIGDRHLLPPGNDDNYSEELVRLPCAYLFRPQISLPPVAPRPSGGRGPVTFGSMNSLVKVTDRSIELWARVLRAMPEARLLIKGENFGRDDGRRRMQQRFGQLGIDAARLDLRPSPPDFRAYLELFNEIDVILDSVPYHGITTSCEALLMGVPVVTLVGDIMVARYGLLIMQTVGLDECVAFSEDEFVAKAVALAQTSDRLVRLRAEMRDRVERSPLGDPAAFTRSLEVAYRDLWRRWHHGHSR